MSNRTANVPFIPPFFMPINTDSNVDTNNMIVMDTFRGDIQPAIFDDDGKIANFPTPFYILCTGKIYDYGKKTNLPQTNNGIDTLTYQTFGLVAGSGVGNNLFPSTDSSYDNYMALNQFGLTPFPDSFNTQTDGNANSNGFLVPVYCYQADNNSFGFFRADYFSPNPYNYPPLKYEKFPSPLGQTRDNLYFLAAQYTGTTGYRYRVGTWSIFVTAATIASFNTDYSSGPVVGYVSIKFNNPAINATAAILRASTLYTVELINQSCTGQVEAYEDGIALCNQNINSYVPIIGPNDYGKCDNATGFNAGYPLNFLYQLGSVKGYTNSINNIYYQNAISNYSGTICQTDYGDSFVCSNTNWSIGTVSDQQFLNYSTVNQTYQDTGGNKTNIDFKCLCSKTLDENSYTAYNAYCIPNQGAQDASYKVNGNNSAQNDYITNNCNLVRAGIYQYMAFQFIPINFFTTPGPSIVPLIGTPGQASNGDNSEWIISGKYGPTGTNGPPPAPPNQGLTGAAAPGPTGPQNGPAYTISYPYSSVTGTNSNWIDYYVPENRLSGQSLVNYLQDWVVNPENYICPDVISDQQYCLFQNYYHALLGVFYKKPQDITPDATCGDDYIPSAANLTIDGTAYPAGACQGTSLCVPNYRYLQDLSSFTQRPFYCQEPTTTTPFPESINGFNNTDVNFNVNLDLTPITWDNFFVYTSTIPNQSVPANQDQFTTTPFTDYVSIQRNNAQQLDGKVGPKGNSPVYLVLAIILLVIFVFAIIYFIYRSTRSKEKDMRNPYNFMYYDRAQ